MWCKGWKVSSPLTRMETPLGLYTMQIDKALPSPCQVASQLGFEKGEGLLHGCEVSFWGDKNILDPVVMVAQYYECTKCH